MHEAYANGLADAICGKPPRQPLYGARRPDAGSDRTAYGRGYHDGHEAWQARVRASLAVGALKP